jgi:hypothetical protein
VGCGGKGGDQIYRRLAVKSGEGEECGERQESSDRSGEMKGTEGVRVWLVAPFYSFQYQYGTLNRR